MPLVIRLIDHRATPSEPCPDNRPDVQIVIQNLRVVPISSTCPRASSDAKPRTYGYACMIVSLVVKLRYHKYLGYSSQQMTSLIHKPIGIDNLFGLNLDLQISACHLHVPPDKVKACRTIASLALPCVALRCPVHSSAISGS
jgi:hypothetical protein